VTLTRSTLPARSARNSLRLIFRSAEKADLPALRFEYKSGPLNIMNNGYTAVRVDYIHSEDFLVVGDKRYELTQFHFHRPSEEYIGGKQYDMVLHLMHAAATEGCRSRGFSESGQRNPRLNNFGNICRRPRARCRRSLESRLSR